MPIVPSRSGRIQELLGRLASESPAERDSAVAGLTLLGARVIEPLGAFLPTAMRAARLAGLEVLDRIEDRAALPRILELAQDHDDAVAVRALEAAGTRPDRRTVELLAGLLVARGAAFRREAAARALVRLQAAGLVEALDPLAAHLLDEREEAGLRVVILEALLAQEPPLAPATLRPLLSRLASSSDPELSARARSAAATPGGQAPSGERTTDSRGQAPSGRRTTDSRGQALDERLVDELVAPGLSAEAAARVTAALARRGARAIPALQRALERLGPLRRGRADLASLRARAAIHEALAALDSRVALYDLRETLLARPRPVLPALLRAAGRVGDASVVPALARLVTDDAAQRDACAEALAAIVLREKLRKTSAALRAVRPDDRPAFDLLWERAKARRPR